MTQQPNPQPSDDANASDANSSEPRPNLSKEAFLMPYATYRGEFVPENLLFNANLQEFAQRVSLLCNLETAGKVSPEETYQQIKQLWKDLKSSKKSLLDEAEQRRSDDSP
ncbi:DUF7219 family protein [Alkalinema pantanalense CENA528]|uniref:DUF7219 family protein n=1 Tax=Alkalinema pantanalense TaxID=1620705 RepID=UPI003D6F3FA5